MRNVTLTALLLCASVVHAAKPPLPPEQWTPYAHLWLSRASVAESGWLAKRDHALMSWALVYNWRDKVKRYPTMRFVDVVRNYCAGLGYSTPTRRQEWIRQLPGLGNDLRPAAWQRGSWATNLKRWRKVQAQARRWGAGRIRDESKGRVRHWGSPDGRLPDLARAQRAIKAGKWIQLEIEGTRNTYYGLVPRAQRLALVSMTTGR